VGPTPRSPPERSARNCPRTSWLLCSPPIMAAKPPVLRTGRRAGIREAFPGARPAAEVAVEPSVSSPPLPLSPPASRPRTQPNRCRLPRRAGPLAPLKAAARIRGLTIGLPGPARRPGSNASASTPLSSDLLRSRSSTTSPSSAAGSGLFSTLRSLCGTTDRQDAVELRPMRQPLAARTPPVDQRWRRASATMCRPSSSTCRSKSAWSANKRRGTHRRRRRDEKDGRAPPSPDFKEGFSKITVVRVKARRSGAAAGEEE